MPLAISTVAFIIFTSLLWLGRIGEVSYSFLVASSSQATQSAVVSSALSVHGALCEPSAESTKRAEARGEFLCENSTSVKSSRHTVER